VEADAAGRFRLVLRAPFPEEGTYTCELQELAEDGRSFKDDPARAHLELDHPYPKGETDIGDVVLGYGPVIASGRVVDQTGRPVPDADISCKDGREHVWSARRDGEGGFSVHWERPDPPPDRFDIIVGHQWADRPLKVPATAGHMGLTIVLELAGGGLEGSVVRPDGGGDIPLGVMVLDTKDRMIFATHIGSDGRFRVTNLAAGSTTVVIVLGNTISSQDPGNVLFRVEDVQIEPRRVNRDPRLQGLAIKESDVVSFIVTDAAGAPVPGAHVRRSEERKGTYADPHGRIWMNSQPGEVVAAAPGYRTRRVLLPDQGGTIVLTPGPRVRFEVSDREQLGAAAADLAVGIRPAGETSSGPSSDATLDARPLTVCAQDPGSYEIVWVGIARAPHGDFEFPIHVASPVHITVKDAGADQVFSLAIPPEVLAKAREMEKDRDR
jgi:protocatechuate 3,4-dioxygenase beta subunit